MHVIDVVPTILEVAGIPAPDVGGRHQAGADRGHQLRLHLRHDERRAQPYAAQDPVFRDDGPVGAVPRGLAAQHQGEPRAVGGFRRRQSRPAQQPGARTLRPDQGLQPVAEHRRPASRQGQGDEGAVHRGGEEISGLPDGRLGCGPHRGAAPEHHRRPHASSSTPIRWSACRRATRRCCSTAPTPSPPTSTCPRAVPRA